MAPSPNENLSDFRHVVQLNEASKDLVSRSYRVNLLALDAMVLSKRAGGNLRGFDELSSQMRGWSQEVHRKLERLKTLSAQALAQTSLATKTARALHLFEGAADQSHHALAGETRDRLRGEQQLLHASVARQWGGINELLGQLKQLGLMAVVLSRAAAIEAASVTGEERADLVHVSRDFQQNSEEVAEVIKNLIKRMRETERP